MAAPKNNQFWKQRSKHGCDKLFTTPELLWDAACEYFTWIESNPLIEIKYENGKRRRLPKMRAMSMKSLCFFLKTNEAYFRQFKQRIDNKDDKLSKDFATIIADIETVIFAQKFEGAAAGFLKENIISRELGLADKSDVDHTNKGEKFVSQEAPQIIVQYGTAPPLASSENDIDTKKEV
ncbi:terminase small subunit [Rhizosphaericola mali]|uniref:DNA packaging protein n=1 Tax=Rhizosphaericola mali TaxID=2545455 RepID=A0A5P2G4V3_9BACT|nr:terminase small subunit [Rhizosphaericola mali]QES88852.1 DNA packaging protein [Rhizosphaericola mali]